jgi:hypothetical protein
MELEYDHNVFDLRANEADKALLVRFFTSPIQSEAKSVEAGRPIFDDTEMIEIRVRGTKDNVVQRPVRQDDKVRFRDAYRAHKDGAKLLESGTPLSQWPVMSGSQVEELKYMGFVTVEQLAIASDSTVGGIPGLLTLKQKANAFLEFSKGAAPLEQLSKRVEESENEKQVLSRQVADLSAMVAKLQAQMAANDDAAPPRTVTVKAK